MSKKLSPNDQRSQAKDPTTTAYVADRVNRQNLQHGNVPPEPPPRVQPVPPKK